MDIKWCCAQFQDRFLTAGERGMGVFVSQREGDDPAFVIQFRALDKDNKTILSLPFPIATICDTGILYCPWCGHELRKWYKHHLKELIRNDLVVPWDCSPSNAP